MLEVERMLTENDVVSAVCRHLKDTGFEIKQSLLTSEKGIDIIAIKNSYTLFIEAKGETSASITSKRFGSPFNQNQIKTHIGQAILAVLKIVTKHKDSSDIGVAIALPDNEGHRKIINEISFSLQKLGIYIFWVKDLNSVEVKLV